MVDNALLAACPRRIPTQRGDALRGARTVDFDKFSIVVLGCLTVEHLIVGRTAERRQRPVGCTLENLMREIVRMCFGDCDRYRYLPAG